MSRPSRAPHLPRWRRVLALLGAAALALPLAACTRAESEGGTIALLLPDAKTARYETFDRPVFEDRVAELGDYRVMYTNADGDAAKQQQQAESALASGARVLVLDPVDSRAAASIVNQANAQGVPVIAYDRMIEGGRLDYYISFDNEKVGTLQAQALVEGLSAEGRADDGILMVNGSPTDSNAAQFRAGALEILEDAGLDILASYDTPDWSPDKAQDWVAGQLTRYGDDIAGVYAANDGIAGGAISAMKAENISPWPIVTGQDADLAAIQRILTGDQHMTVYKALKTQAERAADVAVALLNGDEVTAPTTVGGVPATLLDPVAVTIDNIRETVVDDGFWTIEDICTSAYEDACARAGLQ